MEKHQQLLNTATQVKLYGEWKDDNRHGHGVYTDASGAIYDGEYKDGKAQCYVDLMIMFGCLEISKNNQIFNIVSQLLLTNTLIGLVEHI